jgi:hypothetical protein
MSDHWLPAGAGGNLQPLEQQQGFDPKLHRHKVLHKGISKLNELAQLAIGLRGHMNTLQLPAETGTESE